MALKLIIIIRIGCFFLKNTNTNSRAIDFFLSNILKLASFGTIPLSENTTKFGREESIIKLEIIKRNVLV